MSMYVDTPKARRRCRKADWQSPAVLEWEAGAVRLDWVAQQESRATPRARLSIRLTNVPASRLGCRATERGGASYDSVVAACQPPRETSAPRPAIVPEESEARVAASCIEATSPLSRETSPEHLQQVPEARAKSKWDLAPEPEPEPEPERETRAKAKPPAEPEPERARAVSRASWQDSEPKTARKMRPAPAQGRSSSAKPPTQEASEVFSPIPEPDLPAAITDWHWHSSKWEARAARTTLNEQGGYEGSKDHPGYGTKAGLDFRPPTEVLSDPYIDNFIAAHQLTHKEWPGTGTALKNVLMAITRTRNHNVVVYRANMTSDTEWDMANPVDMFWFDIAPVGSSSIESHRKSKQMDDFIPFGLFDAKGFGMNFDSYWRQQGQIVGTMVAMPSSLFPGGTAGADGAVRGKYGLLKPGQFKLVYVTEDRGPRFVVMLQGAQCYAEKMYVSTRERKVNPIPKILYVRLFGIDVETGEHKHEDYFP